MSEVVPHKKNIVRAGKAREYRSVVETLDFGVGSQAAKVQLADKSVGRGSCLGCKDAPCMTLGSDETKLPEALSEFPGDPSRDVCPTRAISWREGGEAILIDESVCIGCGLCVARCPYGAISSTLEGKAVVEIGDPDGLTSPAKESHSAPHPKPDRVGQIGPVSSPALGMIPEAVHRLNDIESTQFVRNLLIACGIECRTRRRGDTNVRMDGVVGLESGRIGVVEIELGAAMLESPRALIEDVAVMHGRYGIDVKEIDPVSVILTLPHLRTEYYRVMADIETVLGLRCRTVTIGSLIAMLWHFKTIDGFAGELFVTSPENTDLVRGIQEHISDSIPDEQPYPGAYRPSK
jgi:NAD-dependent dihydropyrimidine dehydrogenase PreA subunit